MKLLLCYFSATGNTAAVAREVGRACTGLGMEVEERDITPLAAREERADLSPYDAFIFGAPIHSWRAPRVVRQWLRSLDGAGRRCALFLTYGGFGVHPAHHSTKGILEERNFRVVASAEFPGPHTFNLGGWRAMMGRPDENDFAMAREYAAAICRRFSGEDPALLGEMETTSHTEQELDSIEAFRFKILTQLPTRLGRECSMCMRCEEHCPTGAISAATGEADRERCIACLGCVSVCPEGALKINDMTGSWQFKLQMEKITEEGIAAKRSRIYL
ncbi:MAG: EFR1 family ferrodoxin [Spirochaetes bacterium]|nr:EFR1 family ferrodoxin [Spirochaetota bacterium]